MMPQARYPSLCYYRRWADVMRIEIAVRAGPGPEGCRQWVFFRVSL